MGKEKASSYQNINYIQESVDFFGIQRPKRISHHPYIEIPFHCLSVCSSYEKSVQYLHLPDSERKTFVPKLLIRKYN